MTKNPLILVTNDDGISAPGIRTLISIMNEIGDVVVVAPDSPQSGGTVGWFVLIVGMFGSFGTFDPLNTSA